MNRAQPTQWFRNQTCMTSAMRPRTYFNTWSSQPLIPFSSSEDRRVGGSEWI